LTDSSNPHPPPDNSTDDADHADDVNDANHADHADHVDNDDDDDEDSEDDSWFAGEDGTPYEVGEETNILGGIYVDPQRRPDPNLNATLAEQMQDEEEARLMEELQNEFESWSSSSTTDSCLYQSDEYPDSDGMEMEVDASFAHTKPGMSPASDEEIAPLLLWEAVDYQFDEELYTPEFQFQFELLNLLEKFEAPLYAHAELSNLIQLAALSGCDLTQPSSSRKSMINQASSRLGLDGLKPTQKNVDLAGGGSAQVSVFDFRNQVVDLLTDPRLVDDLLINWENPSEPPPFDKTKISKVLMGDWYSRTHSDTITCSDQLLAGLILGID